ncbi:MAG: type II toxin-antitoxin system PemK/MazF family toxin [Gemmatimonadaceae bacterium]
MTSSPPMPRRPSPRQGEIWIIDLNSARGYETRGQRTALVISVNELNHGPAGISMVLPISTSDRRIATHVKMAVGEAGQTEEGFVKCEELRSVSIERFATRVGAVRAETFTTVMRNVSVLLGL